MARPKLDGALQNLQLLLGTLKFFQPRTTDLFLFEATLFSLPLYPQCLSLFIKLLSFFFSQPPFLTKPITLDPAYEPQNKLKEFLKKYPRIREDTTRLTCTTRQSLKNIKESRTRLGSLLAKLRKRTCRKAKLDLSERCLARIKDLLKHLDPDKEYKKPLGFSLCLKQTCADTLSQKQAGKKSLLLIFIQRV